MKRLLSILLVTLLVVATIPASLFSALAAERSFVSVHAPAEITYTGDSENDSFTVSFGLTLASDLAGVAGYEIVFEWDPQVLAMADTVSVKSTGMHTVNLDKIADGFVKVVVANATDVIEAGTLFEVDFYPLTDSVNATVTADVQRMSTADGFVACDGGKATVSLIPLPPVCLDVSKHAILTDGTTNIADDWSDAVKQNVVLIRNDNCTKTDMDVELLFPLGQTIFIDSVSLYFYHCAEAMIGYPEGKATVLVSTDGTHFSEVGTFDLADAGLMVGKYGTVKNTFAFGISEAAYIKICFSVGSSTDVLGNSPADGKIFWEFVALTEMTYSRYCEHIYVEQIITDATCTTSGTKTYTCSECGDSYSEVIQALGHTESDWIVSAHATCTATGSRYIECTVCATVLKTETLTALGHTIGDWEISKTATCTATGERIKKCSVCGFISATETVAKTDHIPGEPEIVRSPTCTIAGSQNLYCMFCNRYLRRETIPAQGHSYGDGTVSVYPTCDTAGVMTFVCLVCEQPHTETILATGHTESEILIKEATCKEAGEKVTKCTVCGFVSATETIPQLSHQAGEPELVSATCTENGSLTVSCTVCETVLRRETIPALGHKAADETIDQAPTCTENGSATVKCSQCGELLSSTVIPANGHSYDEGNITAQPSCEDDGILLFTCLECLTTKEEAILALGHTEGDWETIVDATEEQQGERIKKCTVCQEILVRESIPAIKHEYDEGVVTLDPTCESNGIMKFSCLTCDDYYTVIIPATGHIEGDVEIQDATCTENGFRKQACKVCGTLLLDETLQALGHLYESVVTAQPSCKETGVMTHTCPVCGDVKTETIPLSDHTFGDWEILIDASCTSEGEQVIRCAVCHLVSATEAIAPTGHTAGDPVLTKDATCTENGTLVTSCVNCGNPLSTTEIPAKGHSYDNGEIVKQPSCEDQGVKKYACVSCDHFYTEAILASGHTEGEWEITQAPSCTETGIKEKFCTVCGEFQIGENIPALGHTEGEWEITQKATCTENGLQVKKCTVCVETLVSESINALGHQAGDPETGKQATCTEGGTIVTKCEHCGETLSTEDTPALGHTQGEWENSKDATCTEDGEQIRKCTVCGEILERQTIPAVGHVYDNGTVTVDPSCDAEGVRTFECINCEDSYQKPIAALGHTIGEWEHGKDATCTEDGANVKKCTVCGQVLETELLPAVGHKASDWQTIKDATADKDGEKVKVCTVCGETLATAGIPKHTFIPPTENGKPNDIDDPWGTGDATAENITLIVNPDPELTGMDITLVQTFDEVRSIDGITLYLYHCADSMIGYPDKTATVLISTDGVNYSPVGTFVLADAKPAIGKAGTVASEFAFESAIEALSVKILLHAGESTAVLGPNPAEGKVYWEYIGVVSLEISEVSDGVVGDVDGDGKFIAKDYMMLKRYILGTFALDDASLKRSDINKDGDVTSRDYLMLKRICLGTLDFPA